MDLVLVDFCRDSNFATLQLGICKCQNQRPLVCEIHGFYVISESQKQVNSIPNSIFFYMLYSMVWQIFLTIALARSMK